MSTLRYALEKLCDYAEAEAKDRDRRPRDKHGPIGRPPVASITVADLRGLLMLHTDPRDESTVKAEVAEYIVAEIERCADVLVTEADDRGHYLVAATLQKAADIARVAGDLPKRGESS